MIDNCRCGKGPAIEVTNHILRDSDGAITGVEGKIMYVLVMRFDREGTDTSVGMRPKARNGQIYGNATQAISRQISTYNLTAHSAAGTAILLANAAVSIGAEKGDTNRFPSRYAGSIIILYVLDGVCPIYKMLDIHIYGYPVVL